MAPAYPNLSIGGVTSTNSNGSMTIGGVGVKSGKLLTTAAVNSNNVTDNAVTASKMAKTDTFSLTTSGYAINTTYQNGPYWSILYVRTTTAGGSNLYKYSVISDSASNPTTTIGQNPGDINENADMYFIQPNHYWKITKQTNCNISNIWIYKFFA